MRYLIIFLIAMIPAYCFCADPDYDAKAREALALVYVPDLPDGAVKYERSEWTQAINETDFGDGRGFVSVINRVPTRKHDNDDWKQPGGLKDIFGWTSELYYFFPKEPKTYVGVTAVKNSFGDYQNGQALHITFAVGTEFHDVLRGKDGIIFEHRARIKRERSWQNVIMHADASVRPKGYAGLKKNCIECHKSREDKGPGSGDYNGPLAPGSDFTFSYPLDWELARKRGFMR